MNSHLRRIKERVFPLGYSSVFKILLKRAVPIVFGGLSQSLLPVISLIFCGHLGEKELDGVSLANTLFTLIVMTNIFGFSTAVDTIFPQLYGGRNRKKMGIVLQKALIISTICVFVCGSLVLNAKYVMFFFVSSKEVAEIADNYLLIIIPSILV